MELKTLYQKVVDVEKAKSKMPVTDQQFVDVIAKAVHAAALTGQVTAMKEGQLIRLETLHSRHVESTGD
jgi:hypothetical protein